MTKTAVAAPERANTIGLVLAGGRATRMGGVNKGLVLFNGEPMAGRVIRTLAGQVSRVWVSANRDADAFVKLGAQKVFADVLEGFPGPLAALDSLNERLRTEGTEGVEWILTVPCDVPLVPETLLEVFAGAFDGSPAYTIETGGTTKTRSRSSMCRSFLRCARSLRAETESSDSGSSGREEGMCTGMAPNPTFTT